MGERNGGGQMILQSVREEKTCRRVKYRLPESRTLNYSEELGSW